MATAQGEDNSEGEEYYEDDMVNINHLKNYHLYYRNGF
jgi:hypothetical protein